MPNNIQEPLSVLLLILGTYPRNPRRLDYWGEEFRERPLDFQGGGPGFFSLARIFFSVTFRAKIFFFKLSWARIFFSQAILGQNIFFYTIQNLSIQIWKQLFSWAANRLQNYYIGVVCCLSLCVSDRDDLSGITLPIPNILQYHCIWGFIPKSIYIPYWYGIYALCLYPWC